MKNKNILYIALFGLFTTLTQAQQGFGTSNPNTNSVIDLTATNKGLLMPRLTLTQTTNFAPLTAHVAGMTVYNTATTNDVSPGFYYNDGVKWIKAGNYSGAGAPTIANATAGDVYVNTTNGDLFTFNGTTWNMVGSATNDITNDAWINNTAGTRVELATTSNGAARVAGDEFVALDNGNVGIGTSTPANKLTVVTPTNSYGFSHTDTSAIPIRLETWLGTAGINGGYIGTRSNHAFALMANDLGGFALHPFDATYPNGRIGVGAAFGNPIGFFNLNTSLTNTTATQLSGINSNIGYNLNTNGGGSIGHINRSTVIVAAGVTAPFSHGLQNTIIVNATGDVTNSYAIDNNLTKTGAGLVTNLRATNSVLSLTGTGVTTLNNGIFSSTLSATGAAVNSSGITNSQTAAAGFTGTNVNGFVSTQAINSNLTNVNGLSISQSGTGTVTNGYGINIGALVGTNRWGIFQSVAAIPNYFNGSIGIGDTTPNARLHVVKAAADITPAIIEGCNVYVDNAAATTAGVPVGGLYRTATGQLMVRF